MTHKDALEEFAEDLIALDDYRNPRLRPVFPDPRIEKAILARQQAELWSAVAIGSAIFVLLLWILPS